MIPVLMLGSLVGLPLLFYMVWTAKIRRQLRYFDRGLIPPGLKLNKYNLVEVYVRLSARFIQIDHEFGKEKIAFIRHFFARKGFQEVQDINLMLSSINRPIKVESATNWLKVYHKTSKERKRIVNFLFGLIVIDGEINGRELRLLKQISDGLSIESEVFDQLYKKHKPYRKHTNGKHQKTTTIYSKSNKDHYGEVLGVKPTSPMIDIKRKYRSLVKQFHPDRFMNACESDKNKAHQNFLEIQEAFEYFERVKKR